MLLILPFTNTNNIGSVFSSKSAPETKGQKDVSLYLQFINNKG